MSKFYEIHHMTDAAEILPDSLYPVAEAVFEIFRVAETYILEEMLYDEDAPEELYIGWSPIGGMTEEGEAILTSETTFEDIDDMFWDRYF